MKNVCMDILLFFICVNGFSSKTTMKNVPKLIQDYLYWLLKHYNYERLY